MPQFWTVLSGRLAGQPMTDLDDLAGAQPALALLTRRLTIWQRRDDLLGGLARLAVGSLPFGCWVRFVVISGRDRTLALAGQIFTVIIPLMIVAAAFAPDDQALPKYMIDRYGLSGTAAEAVTLLFSRPPGSTGTITILGLVLLFYSLVSLTRAMQRLWETSWEMEPTGVRGTIDALSGFGLFLAQIIVLALLGALVRGAPLGELLGVAVRIAIAIVLWQQLQYLLLSRRVPRRELLPGAVVGGVGQVLASAFSAVWMPHLFEVNAQRYGVIGVTFALLSWLIILSALLVASAVISAEWALRRRRIEASESAEKVARSMSEGAEGTEGTGARSRVVCVGLTTLDAIYTVAHHPEPDEKITAARQDLSAGGPAANAAVTCAALGSSTTLVTALGTHPLAMVAAQDLQAHGVRLLDATPGDDAAPALSSVYVQPATARRSVVSVNAAHRHVPAPDHLAALVDGAGAVLVDGHHPELVRSALEAAGAGSRSEKVPTVLDGGSWKPQLDGLLQHVDWAVCGERFRVPGAAPDAQGETDTTEELLARGVSVVAFTHGPRPVTWRTADGAGTVTVPRVHAMDTLGAGDAFHGAVVHRLAALGPLPDGGAGLAAPTLIHEVLAASARVAALRVTVLGPRAWLRELSGVGRR